MIDEKKLLEANPKTDKEIISAFQKLEAELRRLGVEIKPMYTLNFPLDDSIFQPTICSQFQKKVNDLSSAED